MLSCASIVALLAFAEPDRHVPTAQGERRAAAADAKEKGRLIFMQVNAVSRGLLGLQPADQESADTECRPTLVGSVNPAEALLSMLLRNTARWQCQGRLRGLGRALGPSAACGCSWDVLTAHGSLWVYMGCAPLTISQAFSEPMGSIWQHAPGTCLVPMKVCGCTWDVHHSPPPMHAQSPWAAGGWSWDTLGAHVGP